MRMSYDWLLYVCAHTCVCVCVYARMRVWSTYPAQLRRWVTFILRGSFTSCYNYVCQERFPQVLGTVGTLLAKVAAMLAAEVDSRAGLPGLWGHLESPRVSGRSPLRNRWPRGVAESKERGVPGFSFPLCEATLLKRSVKAPFLP